VDDFGVIPIMLIPVAPPPPSVVLIPWMVDGQRIASTNILLTCHNSLLLMTLMLLLLLESSGTGCSARANLCTAQWPSQCCGQLMLLLLLFSLLLFGANVFSQLMLKQS
jgi:hypothetical protein